MPLAKNTQTWFKRPQEDAFLDLLRQSEMRVWPITGPGGAVKSSLLQKFLEHCKAQEIPALLLDPSKFDELANNSMTGLSAELCFYRYAHFWSEEPAALSELKRVLLAGDRSPDWSLQPNIERAEADGHPNIALLKALANVINEEAGIEELEADDDWRAA
jgi:hypothetical protein